jgi:hypothetical protein
VAIRLRLGFSPAVSRVRTLPWRAAAFAVAGRSAPGRITIALLPAEMTSSVFAVHGTGMRAPQKAAMPAAAFTTACPAWRLPVTGPHRPVIAACAVSNELRAASSAARRARACEWRGAGSGKAALAGQRLTAPGRRQAHRVTCTVPNRVVGILWWPASTRFRVILPAPAAGVRCSRAASCSRARAQVEVVLHHLAQHLPPPAGDELLKPVGRQPGRLGLLQLSGQRGDQPHRGGEGVSAPGRGIRFHRALLPDGS